MKKESTIRYISGVGIGLFLGIQTTKVVEPSLLIYISLGGVAAFVVANLFLLKIKRA